MQLHMLMRQQLQLWSKNDKFVAFYREFEYDHESLLLFQTANMSTNSRRDRTICSRNWKSWQGCRWSASKSVFGICEVKQEEKVYNKFSLLKFVRYATKNGNGAEGWSMQLFKCNHISRFDKTQLIYYAIKTRYTYGSASRVVKHWLWNINHSGIILFSTDTKIVYIIIPYKKF